MVLLTTGIIESSAVMDCSNICAVPCGSYQPCVIGVYPIGQTGSTVDEVCLEDWKPKARKTIDAEKNCMCFYFYLLNCSRLQGFTDKIWLLFNTNTTFLSRNIPNRIMSFCHVYKISHQYQYFRIKLTRIKFHFHFHMRVFAGRSKVYINHWVQVTELEK